MDLSNKKNIRNFSIIAHIDHGKSTLADRLLSISGTVADRDMEEQILDSMDIERERGITIKLNAVQIPYKHIDGEEYIFHLIDTPGHIDFTYEVSRSLAACEGALLVVDAAQGVEAQTLANVYLALENNLEIIPIINKIDLPAADANKVKVQIEDVISIPTENIPLISAKTGLNIRDVFSAIVDKVPAPIDADESKPLSALIFDSHYDKYRGIIVFIRLKHGSIKPRDKVKMIGTNTIHEVVEVGVRNPQEIKKDKLVAGEVGWFSAAIKSINDVEVGDTVTLVEKTTTEPYEGYKKMVPMVYCGLYTIDSARYTDLREALEKIQLSDSSINFEPETSQALGFGYRCGFLGLLHMEVIQERLEREFDLELITSAPSVQYKIEYENGDTDTIDSPSKLDETKPTKIIKEPYCLMKISTPTDYIGPIMDLCQKKRGVFIKMDNIDMTRVLIQYELPLGEIIFQFFDTLKSISKGYATMDYEILDYRESALSKVDFLLNGDKIDAFSVIIHKDFAYYRGRAICQKLKEIIPRQNFEVPIQAVVGSRVLARETIKALRKNVTAKCYGGDVSRKKKLLKKQKEGKKRMKAIGSVEVPQEAFMSILSIDE